MTYYTITLIFIFLLVVLIFKFVEYLKANFSLNNEILKNLRELNKSNGTQENNISRILPNLLTIINCLDVIADNTDIPNKQSKDSNNQA